MTDAQGPDRRQRTIKRGTGEIRLRLTDPRPVSYATFRQRSQASRCVGSPVEYKSRETRYQPITGVRRMGGTSHTPP